MLLFYTPWKRLKTFGLTWVNLSRTFVSLRFNVSFQVPKNPVKRLWRSCRLFLQKSSIIDAWQGSKYGSDSTTAGKNCNKGENW